MNIVLKMGITGIVTLVAIMVLANMALSLGGVDAFVLTAVSAIVGIVIVNKCDDQKEMAGGVGILILASTIGVALTPFAALAIAICFMMFMGQIYNILKERT